FMTRLELALGMAPRPQPSFNRGDVAVAPSEQSRSVDSVESVVERNEIAQIGPRLSVGSQPHHLPLISVGLETKVFGESRVEKPDGVWPGERQEVIEPTVIDVPDRGRFPRASSVHHQDRGPRKAGEGIRADGVRQMMIDEARACLG